MWMRAMLECILKLIVCAKCAFVFPLSSALSFGDLTSANFDQTESHLNVYDANEYSSSRHSNEMPQPRPSHCNKESHIRASRVKRNYFYQSSSLVSCFFFLLFCLHSVLVRRKHRFRRRRRSAFVKLKLQLHFLCFFKRSAQRAHIAFMNHSVNQKRCRRSFCVSLTTVVVIWDFCF